MTVDTFVEEGMPIKPGTIVVWNGGSIPKGWGVCDGNNGTPNLLNKIPKSVPNSNTNPGNSGGTNSYSLSTSQMASHNHTGSTGTTGSHIHGLAMGGGYNGSPDTVINNTTGGGSFGLNSGGSHSHSLDFNLTGSGSSVNNLPSYYESKYIMKL